MPYSPRSVSVLTFEPLGAPSWISGRRLQIFEDIDTERPYASLAGSHEPFYHPPFSPTILSGPEDSPNSILIQIVPSDESPSPPDTSPSTDSTSASPMGDHHHHHHHDTAVRVAVPDSGSVGYNDLPASYQVNDPQTSSTRSGPSHAGPYFPLSNTVAPLNSRDQSNPAHCAFAPVQISYYPMAYGQAQTQHQQRDERFPAQQARYNFDARDNSAPSTSSSSQHSSTQEQHHRNQAHLSSDLLESPNWSLATNFGSGRSLSLSQLGSTDSGDSSSYISGHTDRSSGYVGSNNAQSYRHYRDHAEHDADDEGSDTMSDGIASDEGVYSSSGSDRDVSDDEDCDSFEVDSDEYSDDS